MRRLSCPNLGHAWFVVTIQSLSRAWLFATPWTTAHQASLSFTVSQFAQIHVHWVAEISNTSSSATPFSFCLQSFPASGSFPVSWLFTSGGQSIGASASASILPYSGLISFRIVWFDLLAVQRHLKSRHQHHNSKASVLWHSAFFVVQLSHLYMTTRKTTVWL